MNDQEFQQWLEGAFQAPPPVGAEPEADTELPQLTGQVLQRLEAQRRLRLVCLGAAAASSAVYAALLLVWLLPADAASGLLGLVGHALKSAGPGSIFGLSVVLVALAGLRALQKT